MPEAVIVSALRTPIGTAMKGTLRDTDAYQLADHVVGAAPSPTSTAATIDDVILGEGLYGGGVVARHAALTAGLTSVPGLALNRHCAAGQAAVQSAAASIRAGMDQLVLAGGVNSASTSPRFTRRQIGGENDSETVPWFPPTHPDRPDAPNMDMSITVGWNAAVKAGVTREEMDEWALGSHRKAIQAIDEGRFKEEIVPIETPHGLFEVDEHPRRDTSIEKLAGAQAAAPGDRGLLDHRGQCLRRQRRRGDTRDRQRPARAARAGDRQGVGVGRRRPGVDGPCAGRGDPESPCPRPPFARPTSTSSRSTRPSRRCAWRPSSFSTSIPPSSTSAAAVVRSAIRWLPPAPACSSRSCTNCEGAAAESGWPPCVRVAEWVRPPSSRFRLRRPSFQ